MHAASLQEPQAGLFVAEAQEILEHAGAAVDELGIGELHLHHAVALDAPHANHQGGGNHVEHHLLGRAALHPAGTCHELGAYNRLYGVVDGTCQRSVGIAGDAAREQSVPACLPDSSHHVGGGARGGNAYHGVVGGGAIG